MIAQELLTELLHGAYDLHVHSAPDLLPRKLDDLDMARRIANSGMAGFVAKSHFFCTAQRAEMVRKLHPGCYEAGALCLNNAVGGINPIAVEMAARAGARLIWFPTCDAQWERRYAEKDASKKAFWARIVEDLQADHIEMPGISLLDERRRLLPCVHDVLEVIAKHRLTLCTGHISHEETFSLVREAHAKGIERIVITHATFPSTFYTVDEQKALTALGAVVEHCYATYATGKTALSVVLQQIRELGPQHVALGTDLGQTTRAYPDEGMAHFLTDLYEGGFTQAEIKRMVHDNPLALLAP